MLRKLREFLITSYRKIIILSNIILILTEMKEKVKDAHLESRMSQKLKVGQWAFVDNREMLRKKVTPILFGGLGIGSQITETMLRSGFCTQVICDYDMVETENNVRQNYTSEDVGSLKTDATERRLKSINNEAVILKYSYKLTKNSMKMLIPHAKYFVNAIDFDCPAFGQSHSIVKKCDTIELFPFVLGNVAMVFVLDKTTPSFQEYFKENNHEILKKKIIEYAITQAFEKISTVEKEKLEKAFSNYEEFLEFYDRDPQNIQGVNKCASLVNRLIEDHLSGREINKFPFSHCD